MSSPAGAAVRGIVRLSGPAAAELRDALFHPDRSAFPGDANYLAREGHLHLGETWPPAPALVYFMRAPTSYTREDIVEFHTVGAVPLMRHLVAALVEAGARPAEPGEFTRRAFLNGRLDLAQAEAVKHIIEARSAADLRCSLDQLRGSLSRRVHALRDQLVDVSAHLEAALDFTDQDVETVTLAGIALAITEAQRELQALGSAGSRALHVERPRVLLCGAPSVGKSHLFNALLKAERAIVSPHPGTTRDLLEATLAVGEVEFTLIDSAGIRESADEIERLAAARAQTAAQTADILLLVFDSSRPFDDEARHILSIADPQRSIVVLAKADLPPAWDAAEARDALPDVRILTTSARTGRGVVELAEALRTWVLAGLVDRSAAHYFLDVRQQDALRRAAEALSRAKQAAGREIALEFVAVEFREALDALGLIVGATVTEDILDRIFASFCIGK